ncbi:MAG: PCRF domain-containing protein, partial [Schleiferiaceae bacterium]|nr:PCRF domain-containing protein [Schleiferiaceae bacterium]
MEEKIHAIKQRFNEVNDLIIQPDVIADAKRYIKLNQEYKELKNIIDRGDIYLNLIANIDEAKEILKNEKDPEMKEMAKMELEESEPKLVEIEEEIKILLIPKDPEDSKNAVMEIRAGAGGDEAGIFAGDLFNMYMRYFEKQGYKTELLTMNHASHGGYKEVSVSIEGENIFGNLKFESGVHRVQRVPATESQGRVHTSAASVAVLPEAEDVDIQLDMKDVRRDTYRAQGAGGQHVNKTESAVRLTHIPTNTVV